MSYQCARTFDEKTHCNWMVNNSANKAWNNEYCVCQLLMVKLNLTRLKLKRESAMKEGWFLVWVSLIFPSCKSFES